MTKPSQATAASCLRGAGRPKASDVEARTQDLIDVAARLFLANGYTRTSLEAIARAARVAVRTIYVKFGGKVGLFNAIITRNKERYFSSLASMETDMRPVEEILADFGYRIVELISQPAAIRLHRMVLAEAGSNPELATTFYQVGPGHTRQVLVRFLSRPDVRGLFRADLETESLAVHLLNCLAGDQMGRLLFPPEEAPSEAAMRAKAALGLDLFLHGTRRAPAGTA